MLKITKDFDDLIQELNVGSVNEIEKAKRDLTLAKSFCEKVHNKTPFMPSFEHYEQNLANCEKAIHHRHAIARELAEKIAHQVQQASS